MEEECDDDLIIDVAKCMDDYERAGHVLGLSKQILDSILQSKQSDVEIKNAILFAWKRKNGSAATSVELVKTFLVIEERYVTEAILKYLSKKITSLPEIHPIILNWDDLTYSEKETVRSILRDENRSVRETYAIFVTQLMESFMERNVKPGIICLLYIAMVVSNMVSNIIVILIVSNIPVMTVSLQCFLSYRSVAHGSIMNYFKLSLK